MAWSFCLLFLFCGYPLKLCHTRNNSQIYFLIPRQARTFWKLGFSDKLDQKSSYSPLPGFRGPGSFRHTLNLLCPISHMELEVPTCPQGETWQQRDPVWASLPQWETLLRLLPTRGIKKQDKWCNKRRSKSSWQTMRWREREAPMWLPFKIQ